MTTTSAWRLARYLLKKMNGEGRRHHPRRRARLGHEPGARARIQQGAARSFPRSSCWPRSRATTSGCRRCRSRRTCCSRIRKIDGVMAANDAMAMGVIEALDGANRKALVVSINAHEGRRRGGQGRQAARHRRLQRLSAGLHRHDGRDPLLAKTAGAQGDRVPGERDRRANYKGHDVPDNQRSCPKWEEVVKG